MSIESTGIVKFGDYSIGANSAGAKESKLKDENAKPLISEGTQTANVDPEKVFDSLNMQGVYNIAQVVKSDKNEIVDPTKFLSEDRINDIEAMMGKFDDGVGAIADKIKAEFPTLSDKSAYALAARLFAVG